MNVYWQDWIKLKVSFPWKESGCFCNLLSSVISYLIGSYVVNALKFNYVLFIRVSIKESSVAKLGPVCRRVYRIFSHAYFHHRSIYDEFEVKVEWNLNFYVLITALSCHPIDAFNIWSVTTLDALGHLYEAHESFLKAFPSQQMPTLPCYQWRVKTTEGVRNEVKGKLPHPTQPTPSP